MKKLEKEGKTQKEIAKVLGVVQGTVNYHLSPERKRKVLEKVKEWRKNNKSNRNLDNYRKYQREYRRKRYREDPNFRKKVIETNSRKV